MLPSLAYQAATENYVYEEFLMAWKKYGIRLSGGKAGYKIKSQIILIYEKNKYREKYQMAIRQHNTCCL